MNNKIIWLASYPKSGNTWMRYLISNYFFNSEKKFNFKIAKAIKNFPTEDHMKFIVNRSEIIKNPYSISNYWIQAQEELKIKSTQFLNQSNLQLNTAFLKTHNALVSINNNSFTNEDLSLAIIQIVRDPRDVVISYANFANSSYDEIIGEMTSDKLMYRIDKSIDPPRVQIPGSWKFHYLSWKTGVPTIPRILVKYEDLLRNTEDEFYRIIKFLSEILNFKINMEQLKFSIECSSFKILSKSEKKYGFLHEIKNDRPFFHKGTKNQWQEKLSQLQINKIENNFKDEMRLLGYLK